MVFDGLPNRHRMDHGHCRRSRQHPPGSPFRDFVIHIMTISPHAFGFIFGLSDAVIGVTIFVIGNSLVDLAANERSRTSNTIPPYAANSLPLSQPGLCTHHGLLCMLWRAHGQHPAQYRPFWLLHHLTEGR